MIKSLSILTRKPHLTHAEFRKVWLEDHAPMVRAIPEVKKYVLSFVLDSPTKAFVPIHGIEVDAIAELWYANREDLARAAGWRRTALRRRSKSSSRNHFSGGQENPKRHWLRGTSRRLYCPPLSCLYLGQGLASTLGIFA